MGSKVRGTKRRKNRMRHLLASPIAKDLGTRKYHQRIVPNKKRKLTEKFDTNAKPYRKYNQAIGDDDKWDENI